MNQKHVLSNDRNATVLNFDAKARLHKWFRIQFYEVDLRNDKTYQIGTIYGAQIENLAKQVSAVLKKRWKLVDSKSLKTERESHSLLIFMDPTRTLTLRFDAPGNENSRSLGQTFGTFQRLLKVNLNLTEPKRRTWRLTI